MIDPQLLYGNELLVAVLAQFAPNSTFKIKDESQIIHALYECSHEAKYEGLFSNYPFDNDGLQPDSAPLRTALETLQQSSLLGRMNPFLVNYTISPAVKVRYDQFLKQKVADQEPIIKELAAEIEGKLSIKKPVN